MQIPRMSSIPIFHDKYKNNIEGQTQLNFLIACHFDLSCLIPIVE